MKTSKFVGTRRLSAWIAVLIFAAALCAHIGRSAVKGEESTAALLALIGVAVALVLRLGWLKAGQSKAKWFIPWSAIPIYLTTVWATQSRLFGKFDVGAAIFHLNHSVEYEGLAADMAEGTLFLIFGTLLILCIIFLGRRDRRVRWLDALFALPLLLINPLSVYVYDSYLNSGLKNNSLEASYVEPVLTAPSSQPNLLFIYLESIEDTYRAPEFTDAYGAPFDRLGAVAADGLRFDGVHEIQDTGWTIAGITASQCGIPLLSYGLIMKNRMKNIDTFLPGARCLASTLKRDGYKTIYYGAADLEFAGKGTFLKTHGYEERRGSEDFAPQAQGELGPWGMYDDALFDATLARMQALDAAPEPYLLTVLTMAGHLPAGYPAPRCFDQIEGAQQMDTILLSVRCTGLLLDNFLTEARDSGLLDNTLVVVTSDHLAHKNTQWDVLEKLQRQNFTVIFTPDGQRGVAEVDAGMVDVYPTVLELLGYELENHSAGVGRSLLGDIPSLRAEKGAAALDKLILRDKDLRAHVWQIDQLQAGMPTPP